MGHEFDTFQIWGVKCEYSGVVCAPESMQKADTLNATSIFRRKFN